MAIRAKTPAAAPRTTVRTTQPAATATPAQAQPAFTTTATATPNGEASAFVKDESAPHTAPSMRHATKRLEVRAEQYERWPASRSVCETGTEGSRGLAGQGTGDAGGAQVLPGIRPLRCQEVLRTQDVRNPQ